MFDLKTRAATKLSLVVTLSVLLSACAQSTLKPEPETAGVDDEPTAELVADASAPTTPVPEPEIMENKPVPVPEAIQTKSPSQAFPKLKRRTRVAHHKVNRHKHGKRDHVIAHGKRRKKKDVNAAIAQVNQRPTPPTSGLDQPTLPPPSEIAPATDTAQFAPPPPPPPMPLDAPMMADEHGFWSSWTLWIGFLCVAVLGAVGYRVRHQKGPRRRLVLNA